METITKFSQLDLTKSYTYADYLTWKFDEFVELIKDEAMRLVEGPDQQPKIIADKLIGQLLPVLHGKPCWAYCTSSVHLTTMGLNGDKPIISVVKPDIFIFFDRSKLEDRYYAGTPNWIIEIVVPGSITRTVKTKFDLYEESGVGEYWIIYPIMNNIVVYVLEGKKYKLVGEYFEPGLIPVTTVPGLTLEWADIFTED